MKKILLAALLVIVSATVAIAGGNELAYFKIPELEDLAASSVTSNDYTVVYDASDDKVKKVPAGSTLGAAAFEDVTATNVIATSECGKTFTLNSSTEFVSTLPAPTAGCRFRFIVKAAPSGASYTIVTASSANIVIGHVETADVNSAAADGDVSTADDTITIVDGVAVVGDQVEIYSDGTSWYYLGHSRTYNGITATQAS